MTIEIKVFCVGIFSVLVAIAYPVARTDASPDPIMQMGIMQRFGENPQDRIVLEALPGDQLQLRFRGSDGKWQTQQTNQVTLEVIPQLLAVPRLEEKVVLSNHRSFENAAASAFRWQALGIETEIAQPKRWQVWAKRSVYSVFPLSSLLTYYLRVQGYNLVQLERRVVTHQLLVSWVMAGFRYNRDALEVSSSQGVIRVNRRRYAGTLRLQKNSHLNFTLVNLVPLETYLRGVVPHEIGYQAPYAAVQAQAILARTYALASRHRFAVDNYQLCSTTQCQVYRGLEDTSALADRAIAETRGLVLTYNNKVIDALYSSTTGGMTANYNDLWDGRSRPYLKTVLDALPVSVPPNLATEEKFQAFIKQTTGFNEDGWRHLRWRVDSSMAEIATTVREFLRLSGDQDTKFNEVKSLRITERSPSGRVLKIAVETDTKTIFLEKDEIIDALYAPNSTFFTIEPLTQEPPSDPKRRRPVNITANKPSNNLIKGYSFVGGGLGHGVGMSQTGSYRLARMGWSYQQILNFYYTNVKLQPLKPEFLP